MKLQHWIWVVACSAGIMGIQTDTWADRYIDCSKLEKWNSAKTYKKGDKTWIRDGGMNDGAEYTCDKAECRDVKDQPYSTKAWRNTGICKNRPK